MLLACKVWVVLFFFATGYRICPKREVADGKQEMVVCNYCFPLGVRTRCHWACCHWYGHVHHFLSEKSHIQREHFFVIYFIFNSPQLQIFYTSPDSAPLLPLSHSHWLPKSCRWTLSLWSNFSPHRRVKCQSFWGHVFLPKLSKQDLCWALHSVSRPLFGKVQFLLCVWVFMLQWYHLMKCWRDSL